MALVTVYFDDSGTHKQSRIAVAGCFLSDVRRWGELEDKWDDVLSQAGIRVCGFHMADFEARVPPFDWSDDKRSQVFGDLLNLIHKYTFAGMVSAVVKRDYDALITGKLRKKLGQYHYTFAVQACLSMIERWSVRNTRQPMEYVFDWMTKGKGEINALFEDVIEHKTAIIWC